MKKKINYLAAELFPHSASLRIGEVFRSFAQYLFENQGFQTFLRETPQQADGVYNELKIRGWVLILTGFIFHNVISPLLAMIYFTPPLKSGLLFEAWLVLMVPMAGDILIFIGVIVGIINWFRKRSAKKAEIKVQ